MRYRQVKSLRCHVGVQLRQSVKNSINHDINQVTMTVLPMGIHMHGEGVDTVVTYNNVHSFDFLPGKDGPEKDE